MSVESEALQNKRQEYLHKLAKLGESTLREETQKLNKKQSVRELVKVENELRTLLQKETPTNGTTNTTTQETTTDTSH